MDTSISKALIMVAGVLLAMIVIAFVTFSFNRISEWATVDDDKTLTEQKEKFNKEYEVYDKDLMYGVDVISCLNKAKSNNDRINDGRFVNGETYDNSYEITVNVKINTALEERIEIYHMLSSGKETTYQDEGPSIDKMSIDAVFDVSTKYPKYMDSRISRTDFSSANQFKSGSYPTNVNDGTYTLTKDSHDTDTLVVLLLLSNNLRITQKNNFTGKTPTDPRSWTKAIWETPLYDLKTRKFTCTNLTYNATTGRVDSISFEELN